MRRHSPPVATDTLVVGVDMAKRSFVAVQQAGDGRFSKARKFENGATGFASFCEQVREDGAAFVVAMEPTGHYGERFLHWLTDRDIPVFQVQPVHTNRAKELFDGTPRKTDAKDARVIADLCRRGIAKRYIRLAEPFCDLRILTRHREGLVKRRGQLLQRLHHRLDVVFPEVLGHFYKLNSSACLELLRHAPTPAEVLAMDPEELAQNLRVVSKGQVGLERVLAVRAAAETSSGVTRGAAVHAMAIRQGVEELRVLGKSIKEAERALKSAFSRVDYGPNLLSIPHLGEITAAILLGELGDLRNYKTARQLVAMAGLDLLEKSTGEKKGRRYISRRGRRYARQILYLAVLRLGWQVLAEPRRHLVEDLRLPPTKAAVANMCRLLRILHALVRDNAFFDASHIAPAEAVVA